MMAKGAPCEGRVGRAHRRCERISKLEERVGAGIGWLGRFWVRLVEEHSPSSPETWTGDPGRRRRGVGQETRGKELRVLVVLHLSDYRWG